MMGFLTYGFADVRLKIVSTRQFALFEMRTSQKQSHCKSGIAAVELAVCLPILLLVAVAAIETCGMLYVSQTLKIASFEGARIGVVPDAEAENVEFQCDTLLQDRGVKGYTISLSPTDPGTLNEGDYFRVIIEADYSQNSLLGGMIFGNRTLNKSTALRAD